MATCGNAPKRTLNEQSKSIVKIITIYDISNQRTGKEHIKGILVIECGGMLGDFFLLLYAFLQFIVSMTSEIRLRGKIFRAETMLC